MKLYTFALLALLVIFPVSTVGAEEINLRKGVAADGQGDYPKEQRSQAFLFPDFPTEMSIAFIDLLQAFGVREGIWGQVSNLNMQAFEQAFGVRSQI